MVETTLFNTSDMEALRTMLGTSNKQMLISGLFNIAK